MNNTAIAKIRDKLHQDPTCAEIDLENCGLAEIDESLLFELAKLTQLKVLRLGNNNLTNLPHDMSILGKLQYLDLTNNKFQNLQDIMSGLFSLESLKHLFVDLDEEDEDEIIISLTSLESFNGTPLTDLPDGEELNLSFHNEPLKDDSPDKNELSNLEKARVNRQERKKDRSMPQLTSINLDDVTFEPQQNLYEAVQDFLMKKPDWENFVSTSKERLEGELTRKSDPLTRTTLVLGTKKDLTEDCFHDLISNVSKTDKQLAQVLTILKETYHGIFEEQEQTTRDMHNEFYEKMTKMQEDLEKADVETGQLLEAAEILEKEAADSEQAKKKLSETFEKEKEKLIEELGYVKLEKEKIKNKLRQYQITQQKMSTQANSTTKELLLMSLKSDRKKKSVKSPTKASNKNLSLRQLKDIIEDIYNSKAKFDQKCSDTKLPRETMEQYLYTYLNQKYGLKNLILDWASAVIQAVKKYSPEDNYVAVFGKILRNEIDEEFRFVQKQLVETVGELLRVYLKGKYPMKVDTEINSMVSKRMEGYIFEEEWVDIIKYMYNKEDSVNVIVRVKDAIRRHLIQLKKSQSRNRRDLNPKNQNRILYQEFLKVLLDFQLKGHEKFLHKFIRLFRMFDQDRNGILNELEFRQLLLAINPNRSEDEMDELLSMMDPYNNNQVTFSEAVTFLSAELVGILMDKQSTLDESDME